MRGAQEIQNLVDELSSADDHQRAIAQQTLESAATVLKVDRAALERTLGEIAEDPYTTFLHQVWVSE